MAFFDLVSHASVCGALCKERQATGVIISASSAGGASGLHTGPSGADPLGRVQRPVGSCA